MSACDATVAGAVSVAVSAGGGGGVGGGRRRVRRLFDDDAAARPRHRLPQQRGRRRMRPPRRSPTSRGSARSGSAGRGGREEGALDERETGSAATMAGREVALAPSLYVVATPLGHLRDITLRALDVLASVSAIYAEDTRVSATLLAHYGIATRPRALHAHNEAARAADVVAALAQGRSVALITDAGTPAISDPGARVVGAVREAGHRVVPIPGPSALVTALSAAGIGATHFFFAGFLPRQGRRARRAAGDAGATAGGTGVLRSAASCRAHHRRARRGPRRRAYAGGRARAHQGLRDDCRDAARRRRGMAGGRPQSQPRRVRAGRRRAAWPRAGPSTMPRWRRRCAGWTPSPPSCRPRARRTSWRA